MSPDLARYDCCLHCGHFAHEHTGGYEQSRCCRALHSDRVCPCRAMQRAARVSDQMLVVKREALLREAGELEGKARALRVLASQILIETRES